MNLPTAEASNAVVIAKNPAKGQFMVDDIPLAVILTGDPLNNYLPPIFAPPLPSPCEVSGLRSLWRRVSARIIARAVYTIKG
jgi:hypothetical protein